MANLIDPDIDLRQFIGVQESQFIRPARDFEDAVRDLRDGTGGGKPDPLPFKGGDWFAFRPGEVTLWCGYNHHGKSRLAGQVCAWLMADGKHLMASLEMPCSSTLHRMIAQCAGRADYDDRWLAEWMEWSDDRLWLYDVQERVDAERIVGLAYYGATELGCGHIWIDSLMQCGVGGDQREAWNAQALFVDDLCRSAKVLGIHVHLVHHLRKPPGTADEEKMPSRYDARGAGELSDRVDNVLIVHSNMRKRRKMEDRAPPDDIHDWPDLWLIVDKQRHQRSEKGTGRLSLWNHPSGQIQTRQSFTAAVWGPDNQRGDTNYA